MSLLNDAKRWWRGVGKKASAVSGVLLPAGTTASWSEKNYENYAKESYLKNVIAFRSIVLISQSVASLRWYIYKESASGELSEVDSHPLQPILRRPNPFESWSFFIEKVTAYHVLAANSFVEKVGLTTGRQAGLVKELYCLRPDRMKILMRPGTGFIRGYEYTGPGGSKVLEVDPVTQRGQVLHIKGFNPTNDWWGAGPSEAASRDIDTDNEATEWNMRLLQNDARPGMLFMFKGMMGDEQFKHLQQMLNERYSGAQNAGKSLILENVAEGADAKPYGFSPAELDYIEGGREKARRVALAYGVPPQLLGIPGDNTYSNYEQARLAFWEDTVLTYVNRYREELNWFLFEPGDSHVLMPDLDAVPALSPRRKELWDRANTATFITENEKRDMVGYDSLGKAGDVLLVPASMSTLEQVSTPAEDTAIDDEPAEDEEDDV